MSVAPVVAALRVLSPHPLSLALLSHDHAARYPHHPLLSILCDVMC